MKRDLNLGCFLTSATCWEAAFLTLILTFFPWQTLCAADEDMTITPLPMTSGSQPNTPMGQVDDGLRRSLLFKYIREQAPGWAPGLRETLRSPLGWAKNTLRSIGNPFASGDDDNTPRGGDDDFLPPLFGSLSGWMRQPADSVDEAMWLTPSYHHKGFLPFHDAMVTGVNFRERAFDDRLQFDFHPFCAQNWVSLNGYGGAELGIGFTHRGETQPWGHIGLRYVDGASNLMDSNHGFDMNAELRFNNNLTLTAGVHGDENTDLGNYVMLRWKLVGSGR